MDMSGWNWKLISSNTRTHYFALVKLAHSNSRYETPDSNALHFKKVFTKLYLMSLITHHDMDLVEYGIRQLPPAPD